MTTVGKGRWSPEEHQRYVEGLRRFGPDFNLLSKFIQTRKAPQIRYYHNKMQGIFKEKAKAKGAQVTSSKTAPSPSQAKKRKSDVGVVEKKKAKTATQTTDSSHVKSPAVTSPKLTPTLVPVLHPAVNNVEQKPAAIPLPEIDENPPTMKSPMKLAPKSKSVATDDKVDDNSDSPITSATKKEEEGMGVDNKVASASGGGCPIRAVNSLLQNEGVQCILGAGLGFVTVQVVKMFLP